VLNDQAVSPATGQRPFLDALAPSDAVELRLRLRERGFRAGEVLLREGVLADSVLLVLDGTVKLTARGGQGREVLLATLGPGELLGELAAIDGAQRCASVVALENGRAGFLSAAELREFCVVRPQAAVVLMRMLARRLREADRLRVEDCTRDGLGRVALRLLYLADRHGDLVPDGIRIDLPLTQDELASWIGLSRQTVARSMRAMRALGWVTTRRGSLTLCDLPSLRGCAA
jgi:CRP-like cAMP-binding protein